MSDFEEKVKRIDSQGISKTPPVIRQKLLQSLDVPVDRPADVAVITGCNSLLRPLILVDLAKILSSLKISFSFLSFEHCCFTEEARDFIYQKDPCVPAYEEQARTWIRRNCTRAQDLGALVALNLCPGCNTSYLRHAADLIRPVYYVNFFQELPFSGRLNLTVDLYEGCHGKHNFYPESQAREENTLALLGGIEGLAYRRLPGSICCNRAPGQVLKRVASPLLVVPSPCCYSRMRNNNTDPRLKVLHLIELLAQALE